MVQATFWVVVLVAAIDLFFYGSALYLSSHFHCLSQRLVNVQLEDSGGNISNEFRSLIIYHSKIVNICDSLNEIFAWILFAQLLVNSIQTGVVAFQLTLVRMKKKLHYRYDKKYILYFHFSLTVISFICCSIQYFWWV